MEELFGQTALPDHLRQSADRDVVLCRVRSNIDEHDPTLDNTTPTLMAAALVSMKHEAMVGDDHDELGEGEP